MTTFNLSAVIKKIEGKRVFIEDAAKSVAKQAATIATTQEKLASLTLAQTVESNLVDMGAMAENIFARKDKTVTVTDRAVFAFFGIQLKNTATEISNDRVDELLRAKKARLDRNAELRAQYDAELFEQRTLLDAIVANKTKTESELALILESLPDSTAALLHASASAVCEVYGQDFSPTYDDILKRVEKAYFTFNKEDGRRVGLKVDLDGLKAVETLVSALKRLATIHSGMSLEQRASLFDAFDKSNSVGLFKSGELPDVQAAPVRAPLGFSGEAAHEVPKEPVFRSLASYFNSVDGQLIVNCVAGIEVINNLVRASNESRGWTMLKAVKLYNKNPQAALIECIDNFDIILHF